MKDSTLKHLSTQILNREKQQLLDSSDDLSLNKILSSSACQAIINTCREFRERIYTPLKTIVMFIKQILHADKSCRNVVAGELANDVFSDMARQRSTNTGPYCKARSRLPQSTLKALVVETGNMAEKASQSHWRWRDRDVKLVDGTTVTLADSASNQEAFPQHGNQKKGVGFPLARLVVIMSLGVGTVLDYAIAPHKGKGTGEHSLYRQIAGNIQSDDILLGDCYYPSFFFISDLNRRGADGVFQGHCQRRYDFRRGNSLGTKDHLVEWKKPVKPDWMSMKEYNDFPSTLTVREFKVQGKVYVTTLLDDKRYHKKDLAILYKQRWQVEVNLASIKSVLKMDHLVCKSPDMVKKELAAHLLAYNIIRIIIAEACLLHSVMPNAVSFKATLQFLNQFMTHFNQGNKAGRHSYEVLLSTIVKHKVSNRPGRSEPRRVKRRKKSFALLKNPRQDEIKRLQKKRAKYCQLDHLTA